MVQLVWQYERRHGKLKIGGRIVYSIPKKYIILVSRDTIARERQEDASPKALSRRVEPPPLRSESWRSEHPCVDYSWC